MSNFFVANENKTIIDAKGRVVFFGYEDFVNKIVDGNCCFICGASPNNKEFNNEHVIPDWILRKFNLHSKIVILSNGNSIKYGNYKIPCCRECNTELGDIYEKPISNLFEKSYKEITNEIISNSRIANIIFIWLCLIFIKTHLKDKSLMENRDLRSKSGFIGDSYYWSDIHHIHCIARSHYTMAKIQDKVFGSMLFLPAITNVEQFDYVDSQLGKSVLITIGNFSIIANLNDSGAGKLMLDETIRKIQAPLSVFQLRELLAHFTSIYLNLEEYPIFKSNISPSGEYSILAELPNECSLISKENRKVTYGNCLIHLVKDLIPESEDKLKILEEIEKGKRSFILNGKGEFIDVSK